MVSQKHSKNERKKNDLSKYLYLWMNGTEWMDKFSFFVRRTFCSLCTYACVLGGYFCFRNHVMNFFTNFNGKVRFMVYEKEEGNIQAKPKERFLRKKFLSCLLKPKRNTLHFLYLSCGITFSSSLFIFPLFILLSTHSPKNAFYSYTCISIKERERKEEGKEIKRWMWKK